MTPSVNPTDAPTSGGVSRARVLLSTHGLATPAPAGPANAPLVSSVVVHGVNRRELEEREEVWLMARLKMRGTTEDHLRSALAIYQKGRQKNSRSSLGTLLIDVGLLTQAEFTAYIAEHYQLPLCDLAKEQVTVEMMKQLGGSTARRCSALLIGRSGEVAKVVLAEPTRRNIDDVTLSLASAGYFGRPKAEVERGRLPHDFYVAAAADIVARIEDVLTPKASVTEIATGRKYIESIIRQAVVEGASDIHFVPREKATEIRYRIDGKLWTSQIVGSDRKDEVIQTAKMFGSLDIGHKNIPLDGSCIFESGSRTIKLRFSSMPTQFGQKIVARLLDQGKSILPFAGLGFNADDAITLQSEMAKPFGVIVVVGPTGSGKSTTLASLISQLDGVSYSIRTLEDPIEYKLPNAEQSAVSDDMSFADGLRALMRQDPDYILVGEIRDVETAKTTIESGLTGHMTFTTLHANDGIGGIVRLLELPVDQGPLLASVNAFVAQRLVRRLCPRCRRINKDSEELFARYKIPHPEGAQLWEPVGCSHCRDGYRGRVGIYEVRRMADFAEAVSQHGKKCTAACREIIAERKMGTMQSDGFAKAMSGHTTIDEVFSQVVI